MSRFLPTFTELHAKKKKRSETQKIIRLDESYISNEPKSENNQILRTEREREEEEEEEEEMGTHRSV